MAKQLLLLLIILVICAFFRLWQLNSIPLGLYPDEAINGNDAIKALTTNNFRVFYPENNGREGLFINLIALSFSFLGISIWSLRLVPAIIGILTVPGLYLLTKELFSQIAEYKRRAENIALLSSFFLATSIWHVNFSRIGFRGILVPFILVFAFYFLVRGLRTKKTSDFILSGISWGLGLYTYIPFRLAILILVIVLGLKLVEYLRETKLGSWKWFWNKMYIKDGWWKVDLLILFMVLVTLPLGIYFLNHPQDLISRASGVSILAHESPLKALGKSLIKHLGMFNLYGDPNWRHNFSGWPMFFWPVGILFLTGLILNIKHFFYSLKKKDSPLFFITCTLVSWFFIMLLPGVLTYEGIPHALRTIGVIPVVYIFAGLGGMYAYKLFDQNVKNKKLLIFFSIIFFLIIGVHQFDRYFNKWGSRLEVEYAFSKRYVKIGEYLNSISPATQKYVVVNLPGVAVPYPDGIPMPAQTIMFIESTKFGEPRSIYILPEDLDRIKIDERETAIIPMRYDQRLFDEFSKRFPWGGAQKMGDIWFYKITNSLAK